MCFDISQLAFLSFADGFSFCFACAQDGLNLLDATVREGEFEVVKWLISIGVSPHETSVVVHIIFEFKLL